MDQSEIDRLKLIHDELTRRIVPEPQMIRIKCSCGGIIETQRAGVESMPRSEFAGSHGACIVPEDMHSQFVAEVARCDAWKDASCISLEERERIALDGEIP